MALDKSINSGKEKRQPYRDSRRFDRTCRNHGACGCCRGNRTYASDKSRQAAEYYEPVEDTNGREDDS
jgi:hypothetical protein